MPKDKWIHELFEEPAHAFLGLFACRASPTGRPTTTHPVSPRMLVARATAAHNLP
jgi:hypothetical protein